MCVFGEDEVLWGRCWRSGLSPRPQTHSTTLDHMTWEEPIPLNGARGKGVPVEDNEPFSPPRSEDKFRRKLLSLP